MSLQGILEVTDISVSKLTLCGGTDSTHVGYKRAKVASSSLVSRHTDYTDCSAVKVFRAGEDDGFVGLDSLFQVSPFTGNLDGRLRV